jgi:hypothetical protein
MMNEFQIALIAGIVLRRRPDLDTVLRKVGKTALTEEERESLRETLADELCAEGLHPNGEPNERGHFVESLIDALGHT